MRIQNTPNFSLTNTSTGIEPNGFILRFSNGKKQEISDNSECFYYLENLFQIRKLLLRSSKSIYSASFKFFRCVTLRKYKERRKFHQDEGSGTFEKQSKCHIGLLLAKRIRQKMSQ
jgi:hypothetical protein